jgi:preprotein translocase subunit SecF
MDLFDGTALDVGLCVAFLAIIGFVSLRFELPYGYGLEVAARHPGARFVAGAAVVALSLRHPVLAALALVVVFFWIGDVHLLSSHKK